MITTTAKDSDNVAVSNSSKTSEEAENGDDGEMGSGISKLSNLSAETETSSTENNHCDRVAKAPMVASCEAIDSPESLVDDEPAPPPIEKEDTSIPNSDVTVDSKKVDDVPNNDDAKEAGELLDNVESSTTTASKNDDGGNECEEMDTDAGTTHTNHQPIAGTLEDKVEQAKNLESAEISINTDKADDEPGSTIEDNNSKIADSSHTVSGTRDIAELNPNVSSVALECNDTTKNDEDLSAGKNQVEEETEMEGTAIAHEDTAIANKATAISNEDTAISNDDTAISNEDTAIANEDTAIANEDTAMDTEGVEITGDRLDSDTCDDKDNDRNEITPDIHINADIDNANGSDSEQRKDSLLGVTTERESEETSKMSTEKEVEKIVAADSQSDEDDDDKPQIFLRNFAEITEQQSDSDDDDQLCFNAIPSGIASSYQKTISELEEYPEQSSSPATVAKEKFISRLDEIATYDTTEAEIEMNCDLRRSLADVKGLTETAYKLNLWLSRKKGQVKDGVQESQSPGPRVVVASSAVQVPMVRPPIVEPTVMARQIPVSVSKSPQSPVRWPLSVVPSTKTVNINGRPQPVHIIGTGAYSPNMSSTPQTSPIRVNWSQSGQRMVSRPNASVQAPISLQQTLLNTTTSPSNSSPRPAILAHNQQQSVSQLIFDPSTGGFIICPTNQISSPQQASLVQNNRLPLPANIQLQNGVILRPGNDRNGVGISISPAGSPRMQTQSPILMQRTSSPNRPSLQFPRPPMNPRPIRPQGQTLTNQRVAAPVPGLQPLTASQQVRLRTASPAQRPVQLVQPQQIAPRSTVVAPSPPRHPSPRVNGLPPVRQITSTKPTPAPISAPGTVGAGVTAGNQKPIPGTVDEADADLQNKTFPSLVVHVKTILSNKPDRQLQTKARSELDANVKAALINTPGQFTEWLMRRGLLRLDHLCDLHTNQSFKLGMYSDVSRQPFSGGYVWTSECCPDKQISVFSGSIFEGSKYPPGTVMKLIYHWACQTPANNVLQWVKVSSLYLKNFFTLLRAACISWLHEMCPPLGGEMRYVEIGVITLGSSAETSRGVKNVNVEILGVFDPATKIIRMKVINSLQGQLFKDKNKGGHANEQGARAFQILWPLTHWVDKRSILLVDGIIDKALFHELGFKHIQQCSEGVRSPATNMNVMNYLRNLVPKMFSSTLSVLSKSIVQQFLDELSWREMYGQTVLMCYENMIDHVGTMTKWDLGGETLINRLNKVYQNPFVDWSYTKQSRRSPLNTIPLSLRNELGIRECIQHVMKDDLKKQGSANQKPTQPPAASVSSSSKTVQQTAAQKRKLAENTISSNMAFYKSHHARHPKQTSVQQYYYGRLEGTDRPDSDSVSFPPNLKCPLCVRTFSNNGEIIRHIYVHVGSIINRANENIICSVCLKDLPTGVTQAQHMNQAHRMIGPLYTTSCKICEVQFRNEDELVFHMWDLHVPREAPFRCSCCNFGTSFHYDIIQHYQEKHGNSANVLCPLCLKVLPANTPASLKMIIAHIQAHNSRRVKKCSRCTLNFPSENELDVHMMHHLPATEGTGWSSYELNGEEAILMAIPPVSRTPLVLMPMSQLYGTNYTPPAAKKPKLTYSKKKADSKSTLNASFAVPIDTNENYGGTKYKIIVPVPDQGKAICAECNKDVTEPNHFIGRLICSKCRYVTACQAAMNLHHERNHQSKSTVTMPGMKIKPIEMLNEALVCKCGFTSLNPFKLATHLIRCEKITVYPKNRPNPTQKEPSEKEAPPSATVSQVSSTSLNESSPPGLESFERPSSPSNLDNMLSEPITTFEDMLSLDASMDTSLESLSLPPILSPSTTMPQTPMPSFDPSTPSLSTTNAKSSGGSDAPDSTNSSWHPDAWEMSLSQLIAKCKQPL